MNRSRLNDYLFAKSLGVTPESSRVLPYGGESRLLPVTPARMGDIDGPVLELDEAGWRQMQLFAMGALQPLTGFMNRQAVLSVLEFGCLVNGLPWDTPVTLMAEQDQTQDWREGGHVVLAYRGLPLGWLELEGLNEAPSGLPVPQGSTAGSSGEVVLVAGAITLVQHDTETGELARQWNALLDRSLQHRHTMLQTALIGVEPWRVSDEYLIRSVLETTDRVLVHTPTTSANLPPEAVAAANNLVLAGCLPQDRVHPSPLPPALGDTVSSALHLAILYQNLGCNRLAVLRNTRAVRQGSKAQPLLEPSLDIEVVMVERPFHCNDCGTHATKRSCHHGPEVRTALNDGEVVNKLMLGEQLPPQVARPEVARLLSRGMAQQQGHEPPVETRFLFPHESSIDAGVRHQLNGHRAGVIWFTGLSGSGKSTLATHVEKELLLSGHQAFVLDGDSLRTGLCSDLGFCREGRTENLRRAGETARLLAQSGSLVLASFISPHQQERDMLREIIGDSFLEVYVEATLEDCERRDPKGLYQRARAGLIPEFTGVSAPYEVPASPDVTVNTSIHDLKQSVRLLLDALQARGLLRQTTTHGPQARTMPHVPQTLLRQGRSN